MVIIIFQNRSPNQNFPLFSIVNRWVDSSAERETNHGSLSPNHIQQNH
jgi:hypothetical protein